MGNTANDKNLEVCARGGHGSGVNFWQHSAFFRTQSHFWFSAV